MQVIKRHRTCLVACGVLVAGSGLAIALPDSVANAARTPAVRGTCNSLLGTGFTGSSTLGGPPITFTLSGCTDPSDTGGGGTGTMTFESAGAHGRTSYITTVVWNTGLTSSVASFTGTGGSVKMDKCTPPPGYINTTEYKKAKGRVSGGTATDLIRGKMAANICFFRDSEPSDPQPIESFPGTLINF